MPTKLLVRIDEGLNDIEWNDFDVEEWVEPPTILTYTNLRSKINALNPNTTNFYRTVTSITRSQTPPDSSISTQKINVEDPNASDILIWIEDQSNPTKLLYYCKSEKIYTPENSDYCFYNFYYLEELDMLSYIDTSKTTSMYNMFSDCSKLVFQGLSNWDVSNVTDMCGMFDGCRMFDNIQDISNWNVSNVTTMYDMFGFCRKITNVNGLSNWDVSNVTRMDRLFYWCTKLTDISGLSNWNVSNVTDMSDVFSQCTNLSDISQLSNWNISNVRYLNGLFQSTKVSNLTPISNWDISRVSSMQDMFYDCDLLTDLTPLSNWDTTGVANMQSMFGGCSNLSDLSGIENWDVKNCENVYGMFSSTAIENLDKLSLWKDLGTHSFEMPVLLDGMFASCNKLTDVSGISSWFLTYAGSMNRMFSDCTKLSDATVLNSWKTWVSNYDTYISGMDDMFYNTPALENGKVPSWYTDFVENN